MPSGRRSGRSRAKHTSGYSSTVRLDISPQAEKHLEVIFVRFKKVIIENQILLISREREVELLDLKSFTIVKNAQLKYNLSSMNNLVEDLTREFKLSISDRNRPESFSNIGEVFEFVLRNLHNKKVKNSKRL